MGVAPDALEAATEDLETALEAVDDREARYHIRGAAQRVLIAEWEQESDPEATGA